MIERETCFLPSSDQTSDVRLSRFSLILLQLDRLQLTAVYCNRREVWRQHLKGPVFAMWISTRNSRTSQKLNKVVHRQIELKNDVQSEKPNNVWSNLKHLGNLWAWLMPLHAIMHWRSFVFVVSLPCCQLVSSLDCFPCLDVRTLWLKFESPFIPWSSSWFMRTVSVASDLFDFSTHFISFLIISLITLLFLLPDTFYFM